MVRGPSRRLPQPPALVQRSRYVDGYCVTGQATSAAPAVRAGDRLDVRLGLVGVDQVDGPCEAARTLLWLHQLADLVLGLAQGDCDVEDREAGSAARIGDI